MRHRFSPWLSLLLAACTACDGDPDPPTPAPLQKTPTKATPEDPTPPPLVPTPPEPPVPEQPTPTAEPAIVAEVATGFNTFGLELYSLVASTPGDQVISPASIAIALAMTHAGARGETAKEIAATLHYPRAAPVAQKAVATILRDFNAPRKDLKLAVANSLFGDAGVTYEDPFAALSLRFFGAPLETLDFRGASEPARAKINRWVEERTHDRIEELLPSGSITSDTRLVLVNALYFKASWKTPFAETFTAPAPFHANSGSHDVPTMQLTHEFAIAEVDGVTLVEMPYSDPQFAMMIALPTTPKPKGLAKVEASLAAETLGQWTDALKSERVALSMPKFRIAPTQSLRLAAPLGTLGIHLAFGPSSDFTGIAPAHEKLQLSEAFHKGFIEVDEHGTEAAAATAMGMGRGAAPSEEPRSVKIDRPFLYFVRDTRSGLVLFMGRVADPQLAPQLAPKAD